MFIKKTKTREKNDSSYYTFRLVENYRGTDNKVKSETLLNLGANYNYDKEQRSIISHRVESILRHQTMLIDINPALEDEGQRIANLVIKNMEKKFTLMKRMSLAMSLLILQLLKIQMLELLVQNMRFIRLL